MYDNQQTRRWCLRAIGGAVGGAALLGTASADEHLQAIEVELTGEAHGIETEASGLAVLRPDPEAGEVHYRLVVRNICNVTMAHIHQGGPDEDGPVVVWLYPEEGMEPELIEGRFSGTLAEGTFTADDFVGPWEGLTLEEAHQQGVEQGAYVNVHTEEHPGGEIRGQIPSEEVPEEPPEDDDDEDEEPPDDGDDDDDGDDGDDDGDDGEPAPEAPLELGDLYIGSGIPLEEEYIELNNVGDEPIDFTGWTIEDRLGGGVVNGGGEDPWQFPDGLVLEPNEVLRIYSGEGATSIEDNVWYIGHDGNTPIWRQDANDVVVVRNAEGTVVFEGEYDEDDILDEGEASISIAHRIGYSRSAPSARFSRFRF